MRDDGAMDRGFGEVIDVLFGDAVDSREAWDLIAKANDASEVHVPGNTDRRKKLVNTVGQGLNALAIGAGTHALVMSGRDERLYKPGRAAAMKGKITPARVASAPYRAWDNVGRASAKQIGRTGKVLRPIYNKVGARSAGAKKLAVPLAVGALGLHTAELVGDSIAARALKEQRKTKDIHVAKSLADIIEARRAGRISTDQAVSMAEVVTKAFGRNKMDAAAIHHHAEQLVQSPLLPTRGKKFLKPLKAAKTEVTTAASTALTPVTKSEDPVLTWAGEISKMDTDKRQVFGFCTVTHINGEPVVDLQGDYVPLEEIEKAAYTYVVGSRKGGDMHTRDGELPLHTSDMIESVIITPEKLEQWGLAKDAMPYGWWVGFKVNDDAQWEKVRKNERTGFSIHGSGKRVEKVL